MRFFAVALIFFRVAASYAQSPEVPHKMQFAGMTLSIRDDARREIQVDVDALTQHTRYFTMKVERAKTYFPTIERIFSEEGLPDDFKFLVLQESALVPDAVSVSNAVGFWQFKDFTAMEMGLRVDKEVDERMNLVSATRGAAKYLKQNNQRFNNWLLALQSYQMGAGGVMRSVGNGFNGASEMTITTDTYWYVKKFLAHKVAFESAVSGEPQLKVIAFQPTKQKTLHEIAVDLSASDEDLREYNKWLKGAEIPDDRKYTVFVPVGKHDLDFNKLVLSSEKAGKASPMAIQTTLSVPSPVSINAIAVIMPVKNETISQLAQRAGVDISSFLKYNEIAIDHPVEEGTPYFLERKKTKGEVDFYKTRTGDDLWGVSQQCGMRMKNLRRYNHLEENVLLAPGTSLWLKSEKPEGEVVVPETEVATLDDETFDWYTKSPRDPNPETVESPTLKSAAVLNDSIRSVGTTNQDGRGKGMKLEGSTSHTVSAGETLYSISRQYGLDITDLLNWNSLTIQTALKPGQVLKLVENEVVNPVTPSGKNEPTIEKIWHEVKDSDTLYGIARQYGVTIKDIMDWNHKTDFTLTRGEKLEIRRKR